MVRLVFVVGDRVMAVYARSVPEMPYSHAPVILLRAVYEESSALSVSERGFRTPS